MSSFLAGPLTKHYGLAQAASTLCVRSHDSCAGAGAQLRSEETFGAGAGALAAGGVVARATCAVSSASCLSIEATALPRVSSLVSTSGSVEAATGQWPKTWQTQLS